MTATHGSFPALDLDGIREARRRLGELVNVTPCLELQGPAIEARLPAGTRAVLKLELFQRTGSFKPRGALLNVLALTPAELARGICAISAGNHAIAAGYAAHSLGTRARVVMTASANPFRIEACRRYGAEVELVPDIHAGFRRIEEIRDGEGLAFVHPYEGPGVALGTATLGLEFMEQWPGLDAVIIPIGGGGLAGGMSAAIKRVAPGCEVFGVEPEGADTMHRSFAAGAPASIERVATIADSLGAPFALPYSYALCRANIDALVRISDAEMIAAMRWLLEHARLAVEPAGAAATAALFGPLRERLGGKRVGLVVCGSNIDAASYQRLLASA